MNFSKLNNNIEIVITWRLLFYLIYLALVWLFVSVAVIGYYENRIFMVAVWFMFVASYPLSIFLIRWKEV